MTSIRFADRAVLSGTRRTADGYLVAEAFVARAGVQLYTGDEAGLPDLPVVRVWRPEAEVRDAASVRTYSHAPITMGHPDVMVDAANVAALAKGEVSTEAEWLDGKLRLPLIIKDAAAIATVEAGTRDLSAGYTCTLDHTPGTTPDGEAYDAVQRNIRINHVAIVPRGRAGNARIGDAAPDAGTDRAWGATPIHTNDAKEDGMADPIKTRSVLIDGLSVETTDAGAQALAKLQDTIAAKDKAAAEAQTAHDAALAAKDAELAKRDAEIDGFKKAALSDADIDARVAARAALAADGAKVAPDVAITGLADAAYRKAVVAAKLGDAAIAGKSEAYVDARFDVLVEDAKPGDPVVASLARPAVVTADADRGQADYQTRMANAWRNDHQKEAS